MKLVCLGDSFTKGFGVNPNESWISKLSIDKIDIINMGINGDTTSGMLARFHKDVVSHSPKYVLITGGTNDFIAGSSCEIPQNNYMAMIHQAYYYGIIPIVGIEIYCTPNEIRADWLKFSNFTEVYKKQRQFHTWLINFCHTLGVFYIDFEEAFKKEITPRRSCEYFSDGLHLTIAGHKIIKKIAVAELTNIFFK